MEDEIEKSGNKRFGTLLLRLGKYKYAAAVVLLGCVLMLLPRGCGGSDEQVAVTAEETQQETLGETEQRLVRLLESIEGAGKCNVMLSLDIGSESVYQIDTRQSSADSGGSTETDTVFYQSGSEKLPVVQKTRYPIYRGAVVVCEGAERATVRLMIVEAVSGLTGLGSDKIKVIKMKGQ